MKMTHRTLLPLTAVLVAGIGLAACGSDGTGSTKPASSSSSTSLAPGGVVKEAHNANLGTILVTADGRTVYTLTKNGAAVACTGSCLSAWPPVLLPSGTDTATGASDLGVVTVAAGQQVTSNGLPIYTFAGDSAAGDTKGEGLASFGGTWHVVSVGSTSSATSSTTRGGSSGY
jgi:predicted lipoprotein with Yx(FWY)xxD motif